jgi:hypothetical protein
LDLLDYPEISLFYGNMKSILLGLWLFLSSSFYLSAQVKDASDSLRQQASRMANGLITADYSTFIHYLHPRVVEISGGAAALKQRLEQMIRQFNMSGVSFQSVSLDSASAFIKQGTQLQATIRQHTTMKLQQGRSVATSTLIGISVDNGAHWKFVDTNNKTLADMQQLLPNLSNALVIPPQQPPVQYDD